METVSECPVCNSDKFDTYLNCTDYLVSNESFQIQECTSCDFRFTNPRPAEGIIGSYYNSDEYISHNDENTGLISSLYRIVRDYTLRSKLRLVNSLNGKEGRILDVGCGTGSFLDICKGHGWQVVGVEPDDDVRILTQEKLKTQLHSNLSGVNESYRFNIITLWHVLEHIHELNDAITRLSTLLDNDGTLLIAVPNCESYDAKYFREHWAAYDVPRHLYHFTPRTIERLFKKHGFKLIRKKPMLFDAFYIAMLSTRYKAGKTNYLRSVMIGLMSNLKAIRTGNSSSLIYIFRKLPVRGHS